MTPALSRMHPTVAFLSFACLLAASGCKSTAEAGFVFGTGVSTSDGVTESTTSSGNETETSGTGSTDDSGPLLDLSDTEGAGTGDQGCAKVDFVFAIDNSSSMRPEQESLIELFPGFIDEIESQVAGLDYHIMVVDSDANPTEQYCDVADPEYWACQPDNLCSPFECGSWDDLNLHACDEILGAGVRAPYGGGASNVDCGLPPGRRYLSSDDPNLKEAFSCMAAVGRSGDSQERPISAAIDALAPLQDGLDCNAGFVRDDALLVVVIISDDPATGSGHTDDVDVGSAVQWHGDLLDAKDGNESAVVVLSAVPPTAGPLDNMCDPAAMPPHPFHALAQMFGDRGFHTSVCELDQLSQSFAQAVEVIAEACDEFVPVE